MGGVVAVSYRGVIHGSLIGCSIVGVSDDSLVGGRVGMIKNKVWMLTEWTQLLFISQR